METFVRTARKIASYLHRFGVGGAFEDAGIPQIGAIAGPTYLVTVSRNGEMDKLDERLAARQIAAFAELAGRLDEVPAADLRASRSTPSESSREKGRRRRRRPRQRDRAA